MQNLPPMEFSLGQFFGDFFVFEAFIIAYVILVVNGHNNFLKTHNRGLIVK
jgi:hypothetical protein